MKDLFSEHSSGYAQYRPVYPYALAEYLAGISPDTRSVWDCGTGNGQMATLLSSFFEKVYATDISINQINNTIPSHNIEYSVQPAEKTSFQNHFFDLITVCQAVHWFDFETFYKEVKRVATKNALICLIGYSIPRINPEIDKRLDELYTEVLGSYWDKERKYIDEEYKTLPFPFKEIVLPEFSISCTWDMEQYIGYLNTWSAVRHYIKRHQNNPVERFCYQISPFWKDIQTVTFPIFTRTGIIL